jgi:hypothetical protein
MVCFAAAEFWFVFIVFEMLYVHFEMQRRDRRTKMLSEKNVQPISSLYLKEPVTKMGII